MKFAVSNLALPTFDHLDLLPCLRPMGLTGLEVIPSRVWPDPWADATARSVATYRYAAEQAGLEIVGMDGLLADRPEMGLFKAAEAGTADFLVHLSAVCRDLGGRTLVWGGERWRGDLPADQAWTACRAFLEELLPRIEAHGTVLCFAPLGRAAADFCHTARECRLLVNYLNHPSFGLHLSSAAQAANADTGHAPFSAVRDRLDHFHADEPGLMTVGRSRTVDHADCRRHLAAISYRNWVTLKQSGTGDPLDGLVQGTRHLTECYLREDNRTMRQRRRPSAKASVMESCYG